MLLAILLSIVGLAMGAPMRVVVTGAGGQTGGHVFRKMLARPDTFTPVGITRTSASRDALLADTGAPPDQVVVADVAEDESGSGIGIARSLAGALMGAAALVICTSAKVKPTGGTNPETGRPNMGFPDGQPFFVDWMTAPPDRCSPRNGCRSCCHLQLHGGHRCKPHAQPLWPQC